MDSIFSAGWVLMKEIPSFFINPFLYIFLLMAWMQYRRQTLFERKLFHRRLTRPWEQWLHTVIHGLWGGILASLVILGLGIVVQPFDLWVIAGLSFFFSLFHIQYFCFAYAGGLYVLLVTAAKLWPQGSEISMIMWLWEPLSSANLPSLIGMIALFYLFESILVRRNRGRGVSPIYLNGKRGMLVGAYQLQKFWLMPMFLFVSVPAGTEMSWSIPSWWPMLLAGTGPGLSITFVGFPIVLGFTDLMISQLPEAKARRSAKSLFIYGLILLLLAIVSKWSIWAGVIAGLFAFIGHTLLIRWNIWRQWRESPIFVQLGQGVVVLAVLPDTPAEKMGILPGDVIVKVNGEEINRSEELYPALQLNSAFCKMEVRNVEGHIKYLQRAVYQGEHHQLGLILAPDEQTPYYVDLKPVSIFQLFNQQIDKGA